MDCAVKGVGRRAGVRVIALEPGELEDCEVVAVFDYRFVTALWQTLCKIRSRVTDADTRAEIDGLFHKLTLAKEEMERLLRWAE